MRVTRFSPLFLLAIVASIGCSSTETNATHDESALGETGTDEAGLRSEIDFETFEDDIGDEGASETRKVFTSETAYRNYFGHYPPYDVDFYTHWVVFYSAGEQSTGGYDASIKSISTSSSGATLYVTTRLETPGSNCAVTQAFTKPYVLAKFEKPYPRPRYVRYSKNDDVIYCSNHPQVTTCASMLCAPGSHCVDRSTGGECVWDPCPGAGRRNTTSHQCECRVIGICALGTSWNSSSAVCGCE